MLNDFPKGEHGKMYYIFSREQGLILAEAQGVRKTESKLRGFLEPLRFSDISFVKAKNGWRIVDACDVQLVNLLRNNDNTQILLARISSLLKRFLGQNDPFPDLFDELSQAFLFLEKAELTQKELKQFEIIFITKLLFHIGYLPDKKHIKGDEDFIEVLVSNTTWSRPLLEGISGMEERLILAINDSFTHSQL